MNFIFCKLKKPQKSMNENSKKHVEPDHTAGRLQKMKFMFFEFFKAFVSSQKILNVSF